MKKTFLLFFIATAGIFSVNAQLTESFNGTVFPPAGWTIQLISTGDGSGQGIPGDQWDRITAGNNPTATPHSGAGMARYDAYDFDPTSKADLITPVMNFSGSLKRVSFWMYRSTDYPDYEDSITVYVNTTATATGGRLLGKLIRHINAAPVVNAAGWYQYYFDIPPSFNGASNYIIFRGNGEFGNNIYIDDVVVANQPTCHTPVGIAADNYNYTAGSATATWSAPVGGSNPSGYEWALNTTGIAPAKGTAITGASVSLTGITKNVINTFFVRANCGSGDFSDWVSFPFAALPCANIVAPSNGAVNIPQNQVFNWSAVTGATSYNFYIGATAANQTKIASVTGTVTSILNLLPITTYYWHLVPAIGGIPAITVCTTDSFTTMREGNVPPNNACAGAITISSANIAGNPVTATTIGATLSLAGNVCNGLAGSADDDVWFEFSTASVAPSGTLTITPAATGGIKDIVAQVYEAASCDSIGTPVACADLTDSARSEIVSLASLAPNKHYYMRVYSYGSLIINRGAFTITVSGGSTLPVKLATFTARRNNAVNILNWSAGEEMNTKYFVIERSNDGVNFTNIGQVALNNNGDGSGNYSFTDLHPGSGNNYYRIRIVNRDDTYQLSITRIIKNEGVIGIHIFPNPATGKLFLSVDIDKASGGQLSIMDISGKMLYAQRVQLPQGNTTIPVALNGIAPGSYILKMQLGKDVVIRKFNKE